VNKLDGLLSKLDHIQLRSLIKMAVDQNIDMTGPIRSYMNINRSCFGIWNPPGTSIPLFILSPFSAFFFFFSSPQSIDVCRSVTS
jgi:hypothetical protein